MMDYSEEAVWADQGCDPRRPGTPAQLDQGIDIFHAGHAQPETKTGYQLLGAPHHRYRCGTFRADACDA
jgi:hypothetical protein